MSDTLLLSSRAHEDRDINLSDPFTNQPLPPRLLNSLQLRRSHSGNPLLLILPQPRLLTISQHTARQKVHDQPHDNQHKRNRIQVIDRVPENLDANNHTPEIARQETNIEESCGSHAEDDRGERVEDGECKGVANDVATNLAIPGSRLEVRAVEDRSGDAVDDDPEETKHTEHFVHWPFTDEPFFKDVGEAVECGADETEEISFYLGGRIAAVGAGDVVGCEEDAHAAAADEDPGYLGPFVTYAEEEEGDDYDADDGPEVEELRGEDVL